MSDYVIHRNCVLEGETTNAGLADPPTSLSCPDCESAWQQKFENIGSLGGRDYFEEATFIHCYRCGRFSIYQHGQYCTNCAGGNWPISSTSVHRYRSEIMRFSVADTQIPIETLRTHLLDHYSDVRTISAQKAEELVFSVFRDVYPEAEVRYFRGGPYTADDGIDIAIIDTNVGRLGVQVKRRVSQRTEPVAEVRSFITALFSNGMRSGVYVALSSGFSDKANQLAHNQYLKQIGLSLRLIDHNAFFDLLNSCTERPGEPPWYCILSHFPSFADEPHVKELLRVYGNPTTARPSKRHALEYC